VYTLVTCCGELQYWKSRVQISTLKLHIKKKQKLKPFLCQVVEANRPVTSRRFQHFLDTQLTDDCEVVSLTCRLRFIPQEDS
jgi:hypothetical protein